jgi:hypothetical protein
LRKIEFLIRNSRLLVPTIPALCRHGRWPNRADIRSIIYVAAWHHQLSCHASPKKSIILLDQGPVYRLARLRDFGTGVTKTQAYEKWSEQHIDKWAGTLDMVIWLDAPNIVLSQRIDWRESQHRIQGQPSEISYPFLIRYREGHERVLSKMSNIAGSPDVLRFNTAQESVSRIAARVVRTLDAAKTPREHRFQTQPRWHTT